MADNWTAANIPDLTGKVAIVTGANNGIGFETAKELARKGATTIMACRNMSKAEAAKLQIQAEIPNAPIEIMQLDVGSLASIKQFAAAFQAKYEHLDLLINNAGVLGLSGTTTDGFEPQLGVNHFGHFALTGLLMEIIRKTPQARVVSISSNEHRAGKIEFDNLRYERRKPLTPMEPYQRSKLANLLFTYELQRYFEQEGIDAMALAAHPGTTSTNITGNVIKSWLIIRIIMYFVELYAQSAAMGALATLRAAVDSAATGGQYYGPDGFGEFRGYPILVQSSKTSHDRELAKKLWEVSEELTGVRYPVLVETS